MAPNELPGILRLGASYPALLLVLGLFLLLFHGVFVWLWPLGKTAWKRSEYFWLGIAALGVISIASERRHELGRDATEEMRRRVGTSLSILRRDANGWAKQYFATQWNRTEWSPPQKDFDELVTEYAAASEWLKAFATTLPSSNDPPYTHLICEPPLNIKGRPLLDIITDFQDSTR